MSRNERTGWRDLRLNDRHGQWGDDCPATDIDFLLVEYDRCRVAALVEYKHEKARPNPIRLAHPNIRAIGDLAERAEVPAFVVRYADDFSWWWPTPLNDLARALVGEPRRMTEMEWIELLYRCRGRELPEALRQPA